MALLLVPLRLNGLVLEPPVRRRQPAVCVAPRSPQLRINYYKLPDEDLKALWCALDATDKSTLTHDELCAFVKRAEMPPEAPPKPPAWTLAMKRREDSMLEWAPTREMRASIAAAGGSLPDAEALLELSGTLNLAVEAMRREEGKARPLSSFDVFRTMDEDGSGFVCACRPPPPPPPPPPRPSLLVCCCCSLLLLPRTRLPPHMRLPPNYRRTAATLACPAFDEYQFAVRKKLRLDKPQLPDDDLIALWVVRGARRHTSPLDTSPLDTSPLE